MAPEPEGRSEGTVAVAGPAEAPGPTEEIADPEPLEEEDLQPRASIQEHLEESGVADLGEGSTPDEIEESLRALADLVQGSEPLRLAAVREASMRALRDAGVGAPAKLVDAALGEPPPDVEEDAGPGRRLMLSSPEPWPEPVDGDELLTDLVAVIRRFLALPSGAAVAIALWVLHSYAHRFAFVSPLLAITSPEKRCGKTTLLHVLKALVLRPLLAANITMASIYRAIEKFIPTLLVDEADTFLRDKEELRGVLNSGHDRASACVVRTMPKGDGDFEVGTFSTWGPKAIACIDSGSTLPDTLRDRSIEVPMRRRARGEEVDRLRLDRLDELEPIRQKCARWVSDHGEELEGADPDVPVGLHDRAADNWRPLLAIADVAGGAWPGRARHSAVLLSTGRDENEASASVLLLQDLRGIFRRRGLDELPTQTLLEDLAKMDERPWPEWRRGKPITARQLARLLKPFGVGSTRIRTPSGDQLRGYRQDAFADAWTRYLSVEEGGPDPSQRHNAQAAAGKSGSGPVTQDPSVTDAEPALNRGGSYGCDTVTDGEGGAVEVPLFDEEA